MSAFVIRAARLLDTRTMIDNTSDNTTKYTCLIEIGNTDPLLVPTEKLNRRRHQLKIIWCVLFWPDGVVVAVSTRKPRFKILNRLQNAMYKITDKVKNQMSYSKTAV